MDIATQLAGPRHLFHFHWRPPGLDVPRLVVRHVFADMSSQLAGPRLPRTGGLRLGSHPSLFISLLVWWVVPLLLSPHLFSAFSGVLFRSCSTCCSVRVPGLSTFVFRSCSVRVPFVFRSCSVRVALFPQYVCVCVDV
jgi:hypothetical protein